MKITLLVCAYFLLSCSSLNHHITAVEGVDRVDIDQEQYTRPQVYVEDFKFSKNSRSIASVTETSTSNLSNRQLYFLSYYKQYLKLGKLLGVKAKQNACPSFHNVIITHNNELKIDSKQLSSHVNLSKIQTDRSLIGKYPVLALPYSDHSDLYSKLVNSEWNNSEEHVEAALKHYFDIEKKEIEQLCERGVSPGYYVYENLVNYFKYDRSFHRTKEGLKALLKVPVIANMVILDNLKLENYPNFRETNNIDNWLIERSSLSWFIEYREKINQDRKEHLSANF